MRLRIVPVDSQGFTVMEDRVLDITLESQGESQIVVRLGIVRNKGYVVFLRGPDVAGLDSF